jgi:hypothetical protein
VVLLWSWKSTKGRSGGCATQRGILEQKKGASGSPLAVNLPTKRRAALCTGDGKKLDCGELPEVSGDEVRRGMSTGVARTSLRSWGWAVGGGVGGHRRAWCSDDNGGAGCSHGLRQGEWRVASWSSYCGEGQGGEGLEWADSSWRQRRAAARRSRETKERLTGGPGCI